MRKYYGVTKETTYIQNNPRVCGGARRKYQLAKKMIKRSKVL
jgi:hypothetical protein